MENQPIMEPIAFPAGMSLYNILTVIGTEYGIDFEIRPPKPKMDLPPCPHRFYRAYDDGDGRWDLLCHECGDWPECNALHPCSVSCDEIDDEARLTFSQNIRWERFG